MISKYLSQILSARYGRDVRQSIHDGIKEIDEIARTAQNSATANAQTASAKASEALAASQEALQKAQEAHESAEQAKTYAENAEAVTGVKIATKDSAGLVKGGENHIAEDGTLELVVKTTETTMPNSHDGRFLFKKIKGVGEQKQYTGKNKLSYPYQETSKTVSGITFTDLGDGRVKVKGTSTARVSFAIHGRTAGETNDFALPNGDYILSGCPKGGSATTYRINFGITKNGSYVELGSDQGSGYAFTASGDDFSEDSANLGIAIDILSGQTVDLIFKPMIRKADIIDNTWEPYVGGQPSPSPSYPQENKSSVVSKIKTHGKNWIPYPHDVKYPYTSAGVTYTYDEETGIIIANGTANSPSYDYSVLNVQARTDSSNHFYLPKGKYKFTCCPKNGSTSTYYVSVGYTATDGTYGSYGLDQGDGFEFEVTDETRPIQVQIKIRNGYTADNLVFKPMIRLASIVDDTFEPYKATTVTLSQPIELRENGDVKDEIINENGRLKVVRKRGRHRITSAEKGTFGYVSTEGERRFHLKTSGDDWISSESNALGEVCTHAIFNQTNVGNHGYFYLTPVYCIFTDNDHYWADLDAFKAWLDSNEVYIEYNLKEPTIEELPLADQIALNNLETFDGITYLEFDSEIKPEFEGEYGTSKAGGIALEALLVARNNDIRISSVEV